jgi:exodeoxyribonuclease VII large subunit
VGHLSGRLLALSPAATLRRGYAIVQSRDGRVVHRAADVTAGARLTVRFAEDQLTVTADRPANPTTGA